MSPLPPPPQSAAVLPGTDFWHYWAAGKLAGDGQSIYDLPRLYELLHGNGWNLAENLMGSPPWSLWLFRLISMGDLQTARLIWLSMIVVGMFSFVVMSWRFLARVSPAVLELPLSTKILISLGYSPLLLNWVWGQLNFIPALGLITGLHLFLSRRFFVAGLFLSLCAFKPHLLAPALLFLFIRQCIEGKGIAGRVSSSAGCGAGFLAQLLVSFAISPVSFADYPAEFARVGQISLTFSAPTIPQLAGSSLLAVTLPLIGLGCAAWLALHRKTSLGSGAGYSLLIGVMFAPYCWGHSFMFCFIPWALGFAELYRRSCQQMVLLLGLVAFLQLGIILSPLSDGWMLWLPWFTVALYHREQNLSSPEPHEQLRS